MDTLTDTPKAAQPAAADIDLRNGFLHSVRREFICTTWKVVPWLQAAAKRVMDIFVSSLMLLMLSPFFLLIHIQHEQRYPLKFPRVSHQSTLA